MPPAETVLRVGRGMEQLTRGLEALGGILDDAGVGPRPRFQAELVFEEIVTNVIRYGYDDEEIHVVDIAVRVDSEDVVLVVSDDGRPFNPLARPDPALPASLADAQVGGLGIMLVRKAAREVSYAWTDGRNHLTVVIPRD
jgi:serine/threonine-protein kinase RsbW